MVEPTREETWVIEHIATVMRERLVELRESGNPISAQLDVTDETLQRAAIAAFAELRPRAPTPYVRGEVDEFLKPSGGPTT